VADPSVLLVSRGPAAADRVQEALAKTVKGAIAEALSRFGLSSREPAGAAPADRRKVAKLSKQEMQVLQLLASGARNSEIGQALNISADAAKFRVVSVTRKLGLKNRTQAAVFAARAGLMAS
jgi:DNA-binding NarL/FixJ family response regulator